MAEWWTTMATTAMCSFAPAVMFWCSIAMLLVVCLLQNTGKKSGFLLEKYGHEVQKFREYFIRNEAAKHIRCKLRNSPSISGKHSLVTWTASPESLQVNIGCTERLPFFSFFNPTVIVSWGWSRVYCFSFGATERAPNWICLMNFRRIFVLCLVCIEKNRWWNAHLLRHLFALLHLLPGV